MENGKPAEGNIYFVVDCAMARLERMGKRLFILLIVAILAIVAVAAGFLAYMSRFDYSATETYLEADDGVANYVGRDGDINNGTNSSEEEDANPEEPFPVKGNDGGAD